MKAKKNKLLALLLSVVMVTAMLPMTAFAVENDRLEISTPQGLVAFANAVNAGDYDGNAEVVVTLTADLDMTGIVWEPIGKCDKEGNIDHYFSGTFYGNGHKIYNLDFSENYGQIMLQGLFGYVEGTTVCDVTVEGTVTVNKNYNNFAYFGAIAAYAEEAEIVNCTAKLSFDNEGYNLNSHTIGGICGYANGTTINYCKNLSEFSLTRTEEGKVVGANVGGICGDAESSTVTNCHNGGSAVVETPYYGGIVADIWGTTKVQNCYSTGTITVLCPSPFGAHRFGGIVGEVAKTGGNCAVEDCYFAGTIDTDNDERELLTYVGGVIGRIENDDVTLDNNYSKIQETSKGALPVYGNKEGGALKTEAEMKSETFVGEINAGGGNYEYQPNGTPVIPALTYTVTVSSGEGGNGSANLSEAAAGTEITLTAEPNAGYHFKEWQVTTGTITIQNNKFSMPYSDVRVTAVFEKHYGVEATCTDKAVCEICGEEYGEVNASNHTNLVKTEAKPATHLEAGNNEYWYCDGCDKYFNDEAGTKEITIESTVIPKLTEHTADDTGWHSDKSNHWNTCECGEVINKAAHTFEWVIDKKETATEAGSKHEECTVCGYEKAAVEIPATGTPKPTDPDKEKPNTGTTSPQTGDNSSIALWLSLLLASCGALTGTVLYSRKKKYSK